MAAGGVVLAAPSSATAACSFLDFESSGFHSLSRMVRVDSSGGRVEVARLGYQVQAAGYSRARDRVYGIATRDRHGWLLRRPVLVSITRAGTVTELGPVRAGVGGLADPEGAAVVGSRMYVRDHLRLYTIDLDRQQVVASVHLSMLGLEVDDFGADPASGTLYGISTWGHVPKLVRISPATGDVRVVSEIHGIPWQDSYSSVVATSSAVYAVHAGHLHSSELYRITLTGAATKVATFSSQADTDAAGCLSVAAPPPPPTTPTPTPRPTPTPTPTPHPTPTHKPTHKASPTPTPTPTRQAVPTPRPTPTPTQTPTPTPTRATTAPAVVVPPPTIPPTPPPRPRPTPPRVIPPPADIAVTRPVAAVPKGEDHTVQVLRRWSLATLLIILSGGAAMAAQRRMRRRR